MQTIRDWLLEHPFHLSLSAGFFGFYAHAGMYAAFHDEGISPSSLSGSSAGAIVAAAWSSQVSPKDLQSVLYQLKREQFWDPGLGFGILKGLRFEQILQHVLQRNDFQDLSIPLRISVYHGWRHKTVSFLEGNLPRLIRASCAVPLMFHPVWINKVPYLDGGIKDELALEGIDPGSRILVHHLTSGNLNRVLKRREAYKNLRMFRIPTLPKVGPNALDAGQKAFETSYQETKVFLDQPMEDL